MVLRSFNLIHSCEAESASIEEDGTFTVVVKQVNEQNDRTQMDSTDVDINRYKLVCNHGKIEEKFARSVEKASY